MGENALPSTIFQVLPILAFSTVLLIYQPASHIIILI
jgi:hypothetical protein